MTKTPIISSFYPEWLRQIAIKADREPFENLGFVADFLEDGIAEEYVQASKNDLFPIPSTKDREYYHGDLHWNWWQSGYDDFLGVKAVAEKHGIDLNDANYYEMGCASGRVVRHVSCQTSANVWCSDINLRHVEWIRQHLGDDIIPFHSVSLPNLPIEQNKMDMVTAFSVFTHIDDFETMWLMELERILKPGGIAYLTIVTEDTWEKYKQGWIKNHFTGVADQMQDFEINDALFEGSLTKEKSTFWWKGPDTYNCTVFHKKAYIEREWGRIFDVVEIIPEGHTYQDVVVLKKRG